MSLLLDALKKAAQQKKANDKGSAGDIETTKVSESESAGEFASRDDTALTESPADESRSVNEKEKDDTSQDKTILDETDFDVTQLDSTQLDATLKDKKFQDETEFDVSEEDGTHLNVTQAEKTRVDDTALDDSGFERTQLETTPTDNSLRDETALEIPEDDGTSVDVTQAEKTQVDDTVLDDSGMDRTQLEVTQTDHSQLDETALDIPEDDGTSVDVTQAEKTQVDDTVLDDSGMDRTQLEVTQTDHSQLDETALDMPEDDGTSVDVTQAEKTQVDDTVLDNSGLDRTQLEATQRESTQKSDTVLEVPIDENTQLDTIQTERIQLDETEIEATLIDTTDVEFLANTDQEIEKTSTQFEKTVEIASVSMADIATAGASREQVSQTDGKVHDVATADAELTDFDYDELSKKQTGSDSDPTVRGEDHPITDSTEFDHTNLNTSKIEDDEEFTDIQLKYQQHHVDKQDNLTEDDVTQFMGDGLADGRTPVTDYENEDLQIDTDDTTTNNPEALSITNFSFEGQDEDGLQKVNTGLADEATASDTFSLHEHNRIELSDKDNEPFDREDILEDDKSTRVSLDATSTVSSVDIEQLTNDGIFVPDQNTSSRAYAPDNYDRTLINLSEKDVSRIFPGLRPETDTVMTPDYAKRVFLSKSSRAKAGYYKMYMGVGLILLTAMLTFGMFELQDESDQLDNSLVGLKRDPMPGSVKPPVEKESKPLFTAEVNKSDYKAAEVISKANETGTTEPANEKNPNTLNEENKPAEQVAVAVPAVMDPVTATTKTANKTQVKQPPAASTLSISSDTQLTTKSQLLNKAYIAYNQGSLNSAKNLYDQVLQMDANDRDAKLGRAAIHIRDNEYQQAIDLYQQILNDNPKDSIAITALISVANIDPQTAESKLKYLLKEQPDTPYIHFVLGNMYGSQQRWSEAQTAYFEALKKTPDNPDYAYNLAVSLEHLGKSQPAIEFYKRALESNENGLKTFDSQLVMQRIEVLAQ